MLPPSPTATHCTALSLAPLPPPLPPCTCSTTMGPPSMRAACRPTQPARPPPASLHAPMQTRACTATALAAKALLLMDPYAPARSSRRVSNRSSALPCRPCPTAPAAPASAASGKCCLECGAALGALCGVHAGHALVCEWGRVWLCVVAQCCCRDPSALHARVRPLCKRMPCSNLGLHPACPRL